MATFTRFEEIEAWQRARVLVHAVYLASGRGAFGRDYGLQSQIRRASTSILSNIAEGHERDGRKEFLQYLAIAKGSCGEVRAQLYVALDQHDLTSDEFEGLKSLALEVSRLLAGLIRYLRQSPHPGHNFNRTPSPPET